MWWSKDSPKHLPVSTGPFLPGCADVMLNYNKSGVLMRLYYPINGDQQQSNKWIPWLQENHYMEGLAKVLKVPSILMRFGFWWADNVHVPVIPGQSPRTENKLKCVIVSHGMAGSKFFFSKLCCDLASHGYLVLCPEHRDNSAAYTYWYASKEDAQKDNRTPVEFEHYPFSDANHYQRRREQMQIRSDECALLINFLKNLDRGIVPHNVLEDVETYEKTAFSLKDFVGKLDVHDITIVGQSFGGPSAIQVAAEQENIGACILLDPWMFPIKNENLEKVIKAPLLFINTQTFHNKANVQMMKKFMTNENSRMFTLRGTTHENQVDTVLIFGSWLNLFIRKIDPKLGIQLNSALILDFLQDRLNLSSDIKEVKTLLKENKYWYEEGLTKPWS